MQSKIRKIINPRVVKYLVVGGTAFTAEYLSFVMMVLAGFHIVAATSLSFVIGMGTSFLLNKGWAFKTSNEYVRSVKFQMVAYASLALANLVFANVLVAGMVSIDVSAYVAKVVTMAMIAVWNYIIFNKFIFNTA